MTSPGPQRRERLSARGLPRRGLHREEAALYVGVSPSKFDSLIAAGMMPKPKRIPSENPAAVRKRTVWDIHALDRAFDALPGDEDDINPFDQDMD